MARSKKTTLQRKKTSVKKHHSTRVIKTQNKIRGVSQSIVKKTNKKISKPKFKRRPNRNKIERWLYLLKIKFSRAIKRKKKAIKKQRQQKELLRIKKQKSRGKFIKTKKIAISRIPVEFRKKKRKLISKIYNFKLSFKRKRRRGRPKKQPKRLLFWLQLKNAFFSLAFSFFIIFGSWWIFQNIFVDLPSAMDLTQTQPDLTTRILDRNGNLLFGIYKDENRTWVPLSKISPSLINATIAIEDQGFYRHHGFSLRGIVRAFSANLQNEDVQGGSTITQQLVKNRLLSRERTYERKIKELILSVIVESVYSKEEIMEMYLNQVPYGGSTYGIEEAAWRYFNKPASNLTLAESSLLASLPVAPSVYSPFSSNPELSRQRQAEVLRRMVEDKMITFDEALAASEAELQFRQDSIEILAPHFVMYVKQLLAAQFGEEALYQGGLEVWTTLDLELQNEVQQIVVDELAGLAKLRVSNGAAVVTNPKTGEVLAMVGSKNYFDFKNDGQVNVTLRERQPGSSIKPITYATALEHGFNASSIIQDSPITYQVVGSKPYSPVNYDGKFHGPVTLRQALASSFNVPAVKVLEQIGVGTMIDKAQEMGITTWGNRSRYGLSLTLGGGEVKMVDMAVAYSSFANMGYPVKLNPFLEIRGPRGELFYRNSCILEESSCFQNRALKPETAYIISHILSDNQARSSAFGLFSVLQIPGQQVAVKTGTTNSLRDNWTIGYTKDYLAAVWVGNNDNTPMSYVASGITGASPIWNKIMRLVLDGEHPHTFIPPGDLKTVKVCARTGTLPCKECPLVKEEVFVSGTEPTKACNAANFVKPTPTPGK